ncbi:MAG: hypothetical protein KIT58_11330, partial [Planctomycetota bacterium]|nr:hypothetical protein [Planctomycetota bacterium]
AVQSAGISADQTSSEAAGEGRRPRTTGRADERAEKPSNDGDEPAASGSNLAGRRDPQRLDDSHAQEPTPSTDAFDDVGGGGGAPARPSLAPLLERLQAAREGAGEWELGRLLHEALRSTDRATLEEALRLAQARAGGGNFPERLAARLGALR